MGSKTTKTTSQETAVTKPNTPDYIQAPVGDYYAGVQNFLNQTPESTVTPANALQSNAFNAAAGLGANSGGYGTAMNAITGLLGSSSAPAIGAQGQVTNVTPAAGYAPTNATSQGYTATNAAAANAGKAASYNPNSVALGAYTPTGVSLGGYDASLLGDASKYLSGNAQTVTGQSLLTNLNSYLNPATDALAKSTLANYDNTSAQQRAQMQRDAAGSGAFGGSRSGIAQGQFEADNQRNRALTEAELRAAAFDRATTLSGQDAGRRQDAGIFNATAQNDRDLARGQMGFQGALANQSAANTARQFGANATNTGLLSNQSAANDASRFGADARNTGLLSNQAAANAAAQFGANATNQFSMANAGFQQDANLANASAANSANQFGANAANTAGIANANAANQAGQFGANATNAVNMANATAANDMTRFNVGTNADLSKFNASLGLQDRQLGLNAAGLLGDLTGKQSADQRANIGAQLEAGNAQWGLQDQQTQARLRQLMAAGGLLDPGMMAALSGQTITSNGNSTSKESGGLLSGILSGAMGLGAAAISKYSERRVKRDIALVGREPDGLGIYDFRYVWDDDAAPLHRGTMVDEVERLRPWALGPIVDGIRTVNYGAL